MRKWVTNPLPYIVYIPSEFIDIHIW